ncbi:MAG: single-stranded DNA-binding protein [Acidaminococcus provencensis]|jgi:single-strand DNA-binding protein|uniref:single-stranded DNA-binding protein n=1 Tax=Acidaminococcus provencensis TaxID=2058289 RepID=UPI0023EF937B|nr:single-stranded DNA-binding protein [Acidaminococcus provencensis]MCH4097257.1 single-stranded DNA-binding protein [Acidaminococcus provencensis]
MNRIILMGRLVKDPDVKVTTSGKTVCTFTLAVDRPFAGKDGKREADFINIQTWNKTAEVVGNNVSKGQRLLVEGRLQIRKYQDKQGQNRTVSEVVADRVEFIERKEKDAHTPNSVAGGGFESMGQDVTSQFDEEIPF